MPGGSLWIIHQGNQTTSGKVDGRAQKNQLIRQGLENLVIPTGKYPLLQWWGCADPGQEGTLGRESRRPFTWEGNNHRWTEKISLSIYFSPYYNAMIATTPQPSVTITHGRWLMVMTMSCHICLSWNWTHGTLLVKGETCSRLTVKKSLGWVTKDSAIQNQ